VTPEQHLRHFAEFCIGVQLCGGTTPHMLMAAEAARRETSTRDRLWWIGCYAFVYNFATAEAIHMAWNWDTLEPAPLRAWLTENWKGIKWRKERKAARSVEKLAECMETYAAYVQKVSGRPWFARASGMTDRQRYEAAFEDMIENVKYMGRYIAIRWIETVGRVFALPLTMPDLRARDGEHPRKALSFMYPEAREVLMGGNDDATCAAVDEVVEQLRLDLRRFYGFTLDYYTMQSLLCEYKQSFLSQRQYPGKSVDTALRYWAGVAEYWGDRYTDRTIMWDVRQALFPAFVLGEKNGWDTVRPELGTTLVQHGYTWCDAFHDYKRTTDLARPAFQRGPIGFDWPVPHG